MPSASALQVTLPSNESSTFLTPVPVLSVAVPVLKIGVAVIVPPVGDIMEDDGAVVSTMIVKLPDADQLPVSSLSCT